MAVLDKIDSLVQIAVYLNLAISRVFEDESLAYLTGNEGDAPGFKLVIKDSQETQLLLLTDGQLWIASNEDEATTFQRELLNRLNIKDYTGLSTHVSTYLARLLPVHDKKFLPKSYTAIKSPVGKLLFTLVDDASDGKLSQGKLDLPQPFGLPENQAANDIYKLSENETPLGQMAPPPTGKIVFVYNNYKGTGTHSHAEQKLLAALGYARPHRNINGDVLVAGCKSPCTTCRKALDAVASTNQLGCVLKYTPCAGILAKRVKCRLKPCDAENIRLLDTSFYFP